MKTIIIGLIVFLSIFYGCHTANITRFTQVRYPRTSYVKVYASAAAVPGEYIELGYVEAKGGMTVSKQTLLEDMIDEAKNYGADALINVEFYDRQQYDRTIGSFEKPGARSVMIKFKNAIK